MSFFIGFTGAKVLYRNICNMNKRIEYIDVIDAENNTYTINMYLSTFKSRENTWEKMENPISFKGYKSGKYANFHIELEKGIKPLISYSKFLNYVETSNEKRKIKMTGQNMIDYIFNTLQKYNQPFSMQSVQGDDHGVIHFKSPISISSDNVTGNRYHIDDGYDECDEEKDHKEEADEEKNNEGEN